MFRGTLLSLGCGLSVLAVVSASIFLLSDWHTHSPWSLAAAFCIAVGTCFPAWWLWRRRQTIASSYYRTPAEHTIDIDRFGGGS